MNNAPIIKFQSADIDLSKEYAEARKMMGLKSTDLDKLYQTVAHIYICIPEEHQKWADAYLNLMAEIEMRKTMLFNMKLEAIS